MNLSLASGSIQANTENPVLLLCFHFTTAIRILPDRISRHRVVLMPVCNIMSVYVGHYRKQHILTLALVCIILWLLCIWERVQNTMSVEDWVDPKFSLLVVASGKTPETHSGTIKPFHYILSHSPVGIVG